ncbi:helix-turn-helix transcriptional regulator [Sphingosinicella sp. YJ22]|uniref:helix-turn-helix domain-containing protein n=1 Tax=Sphingosinicella sp. YJ22 TaxID=1104780 RepID=UPI0014093CB7|nr:helix-turn-helix transcriptional regulator [Sphingosinicella sp. YJ22]
MKSDLRSILGENIRRRREQLGYTQEGFAHYAHIARTYYGRIERGETNITIERLGYVAAHLQTGVQELTRGLTFDVCCTNAREERDPKNSRP